MTFCDCFQRCLLYETPREFFLVARLVTDNLYRLLRISRLNPAIVSITDDSTIYSEAAITHVLFSNTEYVPEVVCSFDALFGFVKLDEYYHILLITESSEVASFCRRPVFKVMGIDSYSLHGRALSSDESRYRALLEFFDWKDLYYCKNFDLSHTIQHHLTAFSRSSLKKSCTLDQDFLTFEHLRLDLNLAQNISPEFFPNIPPQYHSCSFENESCRSEFVWNSIALLGNAIPENWRTFFVHGHVIQSNLIVADSKSLISITLINRKSRYYNGPRYLKRGLNFTGNCGNFIETELIISNEDRVTSSVIVRGSVPVHWKQTVNGPIDLKPELFLSIRDPTYSATRLHLSDLLFKYSAPVLCVDLLGVEKRKESMLRGEYETAIEFIKEHCIPEGIKQSNPIDYVSFDWRQRFKELSNHLEFFEGEINYFILDLIEKTEYFACTIKNDWVTSSDQNESKKSPKVNVDVLKQQHGVLRINCLDSVDRTASFQTFFLLTAATLLLRQMGIIDDNQIVDHTCSIGKVIISLANDANNRLSDHYSGSVAHDKVGLMAIDTSSGSISKTSRKVGIYLKRYLNNQFFDVTRQQVVNLIGKWDGFLPVRLFDLDDDDILHNPKLSHRQSFLIDVFDFDWITIPLIQSNQYSKTIPFERFRVFSCGKCNYCKNLPLNFNSNQSNLISSHFVDLHTKVKEKGWFFEPKDKKRSIKNDGFLDSPLSTFDCTNLIDSLVETQSSIETTPDFCILDGFSVNKFSFT
ncbi:hypothetical protein RCL1_003753 [Eukaryota sp. TZLM3-RCL]